MSQNKSIKSQKNFNINKRQKIVNILTKNIRSEDTKNNTIKKTENLNVITKFNIKKFDLRDNIFNIIKIMKERTAIEHHSISKGLNIKKVETHQEIYNRARKKLLNYIKDLCIKNDYYEKTFYHALYFLDFYLSKVIDENMDEKTQYLLSLSFLLISVKFNESDINEPELQKFVNVNEVICFTTQEIRNAEVYCLKLLNYNLTSYSLFDWMTTFFELGFLFEEEVITKELYTDIKKEIQKLTYIITTSFVISKYKPMNICLSIIKICREKLLKENIRQDLYDKLLEKCYIYNSDYIECYTAMKIYLLNKEKPQDNKYPDKNENNLNKKCNKSVSPYKMNSFNKKFSRKNFSNKSVSSHIEINCKDIDIKKKLYNDNIIEEESIDKKLITGNYTSKKETKNNKVRLSLAPVKPKNINILNIEIDKPNIKVKKRLSHNFNIFTNNLCLKNSQSKDKKMNKINSVIQLSINIENMNEKIKTNNDNKYKKSKIIIPPIYTSGNLAVIRNKIINNNENKLTNRNIMSKYKGSKNTKSDFILI